MKKRIIITAAVLLVTVLLLGFLQALVRPKYNDNREGALVSEYYLSGKDHDVVFVGDCEVYETFVPAVLWEKYGIRSYVRGSAQQLVWHSYYLLEDTFKYEKPKAVVFNVYSLRYGTPQSEEFNRMTLDGMKWSSSKWDAINASMTDGENMLDYIFPILRYHSRITELTADDFKYLLRSPEVSDSGYLMQTDVVPMKANQEELVKGLSDYTLPDTAMDYLEKMRVLCEENGAELILVKAPTNSWRFWWYDEWNAQIERYASDKGVAYYNFIPLAEEIGIDWSTDTYDAGVHLNVYGAEKMTAYFGEILKAKHGFESAGTSDAWDMRVDIYNERKRTMSCEN